MTDRAPRSTASLLALSLAAAFALYAPSARADAAGMAAPATCDVRFTYGTEAITLPANAPAFLVIERTYAGLTSTLDATLVSGATRTALTSTVDTHGLSTLTFPDALTPGSYTIEGTVTCSDGSDDRQLSASLTLTDPVPLPTEVGSLTYVPSNPPTGMDKVRLQPTPGMSAFLPASQLSVTANGVLSTTPTYGDAFKGGVLEFPVHTGSVCVENGQLYRDHRTLKLALTAAIAGAAEVPAPAELDVDVDCGAIRWTSGTSYPGGNEGAGEPTPVGGMSGSSSSGGCSAAPGSSSGNLSLAGAGVALVLAARRRRR